MPPQCSILVHGRYVTFHVPPTEKGNAEKLVGLGDSCVTYYASILNVPPPKGIDVFLLDTAKEYEEADRIENHGTLKKNGAFSRHGRIFITVEPRPGTSIVDDNSEVSYALAHELCHAVLFRGFHNAARLPRWLEEGVCDAWAEEATNRYYPWLNQKPIYYGRKVGRVKVALTNGKFIPLSGLSEKDAFFKKSMGLCYGEAFLFVKMLELQPPSCLKRIANMRQGFRTYLAMCLDSPPEELGSTINSDLLGKPGSDIAALTEKEFRRYIDSQPEPAWVDCMSAEDVHSRKDGTIVVESYPESTTGVLSSTPPNRDKYVLRMTVDVDPIGAKQTDVLIGADPDNRLNVYAVAFAPEAIYFMNHSKKWKTLDREYLPDGAYGAGPHTLRVSVNGCKVAANLDSKIDAEFQLPKPITKGLWGIGCYDGKVRFRKIEVTTN